MKDSSGSKPPKGRAGYLQAGLVVAPQAEAAHEGARVLAEGGNAADALVTAALVQGVADPHRCGLGGFGCATVLWNQPRQAVAVGFYGRAGEKARPDQWKDLLEHEAPDGFGYVIKGKGNDVGYQSITTPGTLAGLAAIHRRFGSRGWKELVDQAAEAAEQGFLVGTGLAEFWIRPGLYGRVSTRERLSFTEYGRRTWFDAQGETFKSGTRVRLPDLARTYRQIAQEGPESFYRGSIAAVMAQDLESNGSLVTANDLRRYQAKEEKPLEGRYRGHRILTSPLPGGGAALLQALRLIEELPLNALAHNSLEYIERLGAVFKAVWRDRLDHHGDPEFMDRRPEELLSEAHLARLLQGVRGPAPSLDRESADTTHVSIVDRFGNCAAFSHSLGYGSGVFSGQLGFMHNNCMSGFDPRPGQPNSIVPGKARSTAIAETIVLREDGLREDGRPLLVLGSPGAARITAALAQVIINVIDHGMPVAEAVLHPRFDGYGERTIFLESRFPLPVADALKARGWEVVQSPKPFGMVGRVYAIEITAGGRLVAGVDPGEPGAAVRG
ncbi:MAG: gamma-glutamyltransferase [Planctomycetes bacterium]|nr:gamma-glutamyltransferase [Planctomycetota bacterium]